MIEDATHVDRAAPAFASGTIGKVPAERQRVPVVDTEHDGIGIFLAGRAGDAVDGCVRAEQDHLRPGSWQHAGQGIADQVVDLQDGEHDAHAVESRRDSTQAIGEVADVRSLPRLQPGDLGWGSEVDARSYGAAWQATGQPLERDRQVALTLQVGTALDDLVRKPLLRRSLHLMRGPARAAGLADLQAFLERGFEAFSAMQGAAEFLTLVAQRERQLAAALFQAVDSDPMRIALTLLPRE